MFIGSKSLPVDGQNAHVEKTRPAANQTKRCQENAQTVPLSKVFLAKEDSNVRESVDEQGNSKIGEGQIHH